MIPEDIQNFLEQEKISYELYRHPAMHTAEDEDIFFKKISFGKTKNLFLTNKKKDAFYLVVTETTKRVDISNLRKKIGESKLSFASDDFLFSFLGVRPGSVSLLCLLRNKRKNVWVFLDKILRERKEIYLHPCDNNFSLKISSCDMEKIPMYTGHEYKYIEL